ncbi:MAG: hypothetical protein V3W31_05230 [Thermodesulfobacteriota bacterium]
MALYIRMALLLLLILSPAIYLSEAPYSFFSPEDAAIKVAFKHSGTKVVGCEEEDLVKRSGEKYREGLKGTSGVSMDLSEIGGCPRERHPISVELFLDGRKLLDKDYEAMGIKKDMASYVYERFIIERGTHTVLVKMTDSGPSSPTVYTLEKTVDVAPAEILVIRFDPISRRLVME